MKFQQPAIYTSNSNISRERQRVPVKRVQSSYISSNNKSKLSGIFNENLTPENAVCSKILIKEKILCCNENNIKTGSYNNNFCFDDCPNFSFSKKLEKDLKDLIESNINLKKMNEFLLKTITIKDDLFIDVTNENKNLKLDNNILNSHIGSRRILSGRQCQIRNSLKNSFIADFRDNTQNPNNSSAFLNAKKASNSIISANTLNNFYNKEGNNLISARGQNNNNLTNSAVKKKGKDSNDNKEVQSNMNAGYPKSNNLNTFLTLASKQKKKNNEFISINNNNNDFKGSQIEGINDFSLKGSNSIWNSHLKNPNFNASSIIHKNNSISNININPNKDQNNINLDQNFNNEIEKNNNVNDLNYVENQTISAQVSPTCLITKITSQEVNKNKQRNSLSSNTSNHINNNNKSYKNLNINQINNNSNIVSNTNNKSHLNINNNYNNNNNISSSCANSSSNNLKQNNFYENISNLVAKNNHKNVKFKNKARSSLLGLNDEALSKIISNEIISNLKKITLSDEEFIDFFRTTSEDILISYCDAIYQLIRDMESAIKLIQRMRGYIVITASLANCSLIEEIAAFIIKDACKIMDCDRTSIFIYDNLSDMLVVHTGEGLKRNDIRVPKNLGIIGNAFTKGEIIRVDEAYADSRFNKDFDRKSNYVTKTILAAPLKDSSSVPFGVIQSINKNNNAKFTDDDEELIHLFSLHISQIMKSAKTNDQNISYIAKLKMIIGFKEKILKIENVMDLICCIENIIVNIFSTQYSQILIYNETKNNLVKISKYEKSEKNKNIGIVGYVFERKEYFGINSCNGCEFYNNLIDIETGMSILTYPIINNGNVKAILQFAYNDKLIHFKKPKETDDQIISYILLDCEKWFNKNEEIVNKFFAS